MVATTRAMSIDIDVLLDSMIERLNAYEYEEEIQHRDDLLSFATPYVILSNLHSYA
jgi:hypothetical protein